MSEHDLHELLTGDTVCLATWQRELSLRIGESCGTHAHVVSGRRRQRSVSLNL